MDNLEKILEKLENRASKLEEDFVFVKIQLKKLEDLLENKVVPNLEKLERCIWGRLEEGGQSGVIGEISKLKSDFLFFKRIWIGIWSVVIIIISSLVQIFIRGLFR